MVPSLRSRRLRLRPSILNRYPPSLKDALFPHRNTEQSPRVFCTRWIKVSKLFTRYSHALVQSTENTALVPVHLKAYFGASRSKLQSFEPTIAGQKEIAKGAGVGSIHTVAAPAPQPQPSSFETASTPCELSNASELSYGKSAMAAEFSGAGDGIGSGLFEGPFWFWHCYGHRYRLRALRESC